MAKSARIAPALALVAVSLIAAIVLVVLGRGNLAHKKTILKQVAPKWSAELGTDSVFLPHKPVSGITFHALKARFQALDSNLMSGLKARFEQLDEVPSAQPDIKAVEMQYNLCESCYTAKCPYFEQNGCDREYVKPQCYPEVLLAACPDCGKEGCEAVVEFVQNDEGLNATAGGDNITKISILRDLTWAAAQQNSVETFPQFRSCISAADTVALAENCLVDFLHPFPADILKAAEEDSSVVGPPVCANNYLGAACSPLPAPADYQGTCPKGFMCMPDPNQCDTCACSCNSPTDKIDQLEACIGHAPHPSQGLFCFQSFFAQLPPAFVDRVVSLADQARSPDEQYFLILNECGGPDNGTTVLSSCLEEVEYCIRPKQGLPGEFPTDPHQFQSLCECFRSPTVLAACGPEPANQTQCLGSIRDHYVDHVHHKYCVTHTEPACQFECRWPLPGFFGDLIAKGASA